MHGMLSSVLKCLPTCATIYTVQNRERTSLRLSTGERKAKGRENRERIEQRQQEKKDGTYQPPHISERQPGPRLPSNQREMQAHLTGRYTDQFRGPINRKERRWWDKWWKLKGRGFTKPMKKGERFDD